MLLTGILIIIGFPSPRTLSFQAQNLPFLLQFLPTVASLFFFRTGYMDSPDCLLLLLSISVYILVFVLHFLVVGSVR